MVRRTALLWLSAVSLAGCVGATLTPALQPAAPLPAPGHVLVYNFAAMPTQSFIVARQWISGEERYGLEKVCL